MLMGRHEQCRCQEHGRRGPRRESLLTSASSDASVRSLRDASYYVHLGIALFLGRWTRRVLSAQRPQVRESDQLT